VLFIQFLADIAVTNSGLLLQPPKYCMWQVFGLRGERSDGGVMVRGFRLSIHPTRPSPIPEHMIRRIVLYDVRDLGRLFACNVLWDLREVGESLVLIIPGWDRGSCSGIRSTGAASVSTLSKLSSLTLCVLRMQKMVLYRLLTLFNWINRLHDS